jgi:hypothetical protein
MDVFFLGATQENTCVVTRHTRIEGLVEHFDTSDRCLGGVFDTNDLDFFTDFHDTAFDAASYNGTTSFDRKDVFDRHKERLVSITNWIRDVIVKGVDEFKYFLCVFIVSALCFKRFEAGTADNRSILAVKVICGQKITDLFFDEINQVRVVDHVDFVDEHCDAWYTNLIGQEHVLTRLRHHTVGCCNYEHCTVHLCGTGENVAPNPGNRMPLKAMPIGSFVYNVELKPGQGGKIGRSAGTHIELIARDQGYADLKMPSSEVRKVSENCWATLGEVSNDEHHLVSLGKAAPPAAEAPKRGGRKAAAAK